MANGTKKAARIAELERQLKATQAQLVHRHHFADAALAKISKANFQGSGVIVSVTSIDGNPIVEPILICDGLSQEAVTALRTDITRSFLSAMEFEPAGAKGD